MSRVTLKELLSRRRGTVKEYPECKNQHWCLFPSSPKITSRTWNLFCLSFPLRFCNKYVLPSNSVKDTGAQRLRFKYFQWFKGVKSSTNSLQLLKCYCFSPLAAVHALCNFSLGALNLYCTNERKLLLCWTAVAFSSALASAASPSCFPLTKAVFALNAWHSWA